MSWKPIATAPKDGTYIQLVQEQPDLSRPAFIPLAARWSRNKDPELSGWHDTEGYYDRSWKPTHWDHLQAPPGRSSYKPDRNITAGNWVVRGHSRIEADTDAVPCICVMSQGSEADAALICVAPKMLKCLRELASATLAEYSPVHHESLEEARRIIKQLNITENNNERPE